MSLERNEKMMRKALRNSVSVGVAWYLMAAYTYYHEDQPILSDQSFDKLAKLLKKNWTEIQHRHKHLISEEELEAGTLLLDKDSFPLIAVDTAKKLIPTS